MLFDGVSLDGWRAFRGGRPEGWRPVAGCLERTGPGGDIITDEQYEDFVLRLEWCVDPGGNSGIFFRVSEELDHVWLSGPEMQVLDDALHHDGQNELTSAGANYALHAPSKDVVRPAGEWNQVELEVSGDSVTHRLNGVKVVEYRLWSPAWKELVANSKFASMPRYGKVVRGHIALQDHGDRVRYRNVRLLDLTGR